MAGIAPAEARGSGAGGDGMAPADPVVAAAVVAEAAGAGPAVADADAAVAGRSSTAATPAIDWAAEVAAALAERQKRRAARADLRDEMARRRERWLAYRHRARLAHHGHPRDGRGTAEGGFT